MIILAVAKRNEFYVWKNTFAKCTIEAVLKNDHVSFREHYNGHVTILREELVQSLFPKDIPIRDRPCLIKDNKEFYAILNRKKEKYKHIFEKIIEQSKPPKINIKRKPKILRRK
jgi:hypothetical protein